MIIKHRQDPKAKEESVPKANITFETDAFCKELPVGAPDRTADLIPRLHYRRIASRVGYSAELSYSIDDAVLGLALPIYFIPNDKGAFTGGIRFGWRSDEHKLLGSVFVSKPFSLL